MNVAKRLLKAAPIDPDAMPVSVARELYQLHRVADGWAHHTGARLLSWANENAKFDKTDAITVGLALAPANASGHNVCDASTPACRKGCVAYAGRGEMPNVQRGRVTKTKFLVAEPQAFVTLLHHELKLAIARHPQGVQARLNTFSDLPWEWIAPKLFDLPIQFYDYTKLWDRVDDPSRPANYHLTYSASERTQEVFVTEAARYGFNVAMAFDAKPSQPLPASWNGVPVVDGDKSDDRTQDPQGVIVGLRAKGRMRGDKSGFVRGVV
jgi:hypothetical protein